MSHSRIRNIKLLGIIAAIASSVAAIAAGDIPTAFGIIGAALSSAGVLSPTPSDSVQP